MLQLSVEWCNCSVFWPLACQHGSCKVAALERFQPSACYYDSCKVVATVNLDPRPVSTTAAKWQQLNVLPPGLSVRQLQVAAIANFAL